MSERKILIPTDQRAETLAVAERVSQGSVLGPTLWNVLFDDLLRIILPPGVEVVAYANDLAVLVSAIAVLDLEAATGTTIWQIREWMVTRGLSLAPHKSEAIMFSGRRSADLPEIEVEGHRLTLNRGIKYLGVTLDWNLTFSSHVRTVAERAAAAAAKAVGRLMPNIGDPSTAKRALLQSVASSRLLYSAPVWAIRAWQFACNRNALIRAQRLSVMCIIRSYRTVSEAAALVLTGFHPGRPLGNRVVRTFSEGYG